MTEYASTQFGQPCGVDAVEALERLGGIASLHALLDLTTRRWLRTAVESQAIRKAGMTATHCLQPTRRAARLSRATAGQPTR